MEEREKERLLWNLRSLSGEAGDLAARLNEDGLGWRPIPDKWSLKEILCHLRDVEREIFQIRYNLILKEDNPFLAEVDEHELTARGDYLNQDAAAALAELRLLRADTIRLLEGASLAAWERSAVHWSDGSVILHDIVVKQCDHDANHLARMRDIVRLKMPW